jgi:hypothetical protein
MPEDLRNKIVNNDFNVEDIVQFAVSGDISGIEFLNKSIEEFSWKAIGDNDLQDHPPFKTWALIVICYLESGFSGLKNYVFSDAGAYLETSRFVISVLDDIQTEESVRCLMNLFKDLIDNPTKNHELSIKLISAFNLLLSFSKAIKLESSEKTIIRNFIYKYLDSYNDVEGNRSSAFCALRAVGDLDSIVKIKTYPKLTGAYKGVESIVIKAIKSRL